MRAARVVAVAAGEGAGSVIERAILGPARCQGCDYSVVLIAKPGRIVGWCHPDGRLTCRERKPMPEGLTRQRYKMLKAREYRQKVTP